MCQIETPSKKLLSSATPVWELLGIAPLPSYAMASLAVQSYQRCPSGTGPVRPVELRRRPSNGERWGGTRVASSSAHGAASGNRQGPEPGSSASTKGLPVICRFFTLSTGSCI
ncbi:polypyrimidine tract-binding protein 1 [Platysternon megacephalum]|uniref:Polypyrimidine tract-binding protein 1 n=1 Tax=Platysternon megacephalum TaxID=55544 RepID=A0A4D9EAV6_9SAUR|nr:polypyrimidine tract-binding protein 1 [Platysternon megacephalum]